jgi:hypothetical protein|tara:strand:+ start:8133 stop:8321 length:189 start_codon:yes stop_codon:yes gene_type:complete
MKIKPKENYRLLGTYPVITLNKNKVYKVIKATNQPNYKENGLVFCDNILLNKNEYTVIKEGN